MILSPSPSTTPVSILPIANWSVHKPVCRLAQKDHSHAPLPFNIPLSTFLLVDKAKREGEWPPQQQQQQDEFSDRFTEVD